MRKSYFFLLFCVITLFSCVPQRKIVYVQSNEDRTAYEYLVKNKKSLRIEPFDMLYISIGSLDQQGYNFFDQQKGSSAAISISESSLAILSYTVNDSGYISLPILGKLKLKGLTVDEASVSIKNFTKNVLNNPIVTVRFVNNSITVLGEVARPGSYNYYNEQLNIFHALGLAGDITEYGNRRKITLMREKNNIIYKYHLDVTKDEIYKSDYYYLRPNDVIYIEPLKIRRWGVRNFNELPLNVLFTGITTAVTTYLLYKSIKN
ncbi:MAG: polysaccharide biosynthesis/export family protein [Bacteroidia bacterium]